MKKNDTTDLPELDTIESADPDQENLDADEQLDRAEINPLIDQSESDAPRTDDSNEIETPLIVEALLFASDSPVTAAKIAQTIGNVSANEVKRAIQSLNDKYESSGISFRVEEIAHGFQMLTLPEFNGWVRKHLRVRSDTKLSSAALETLAVIAYKQSVTRAQIEEVRGVAAGEVVNRLREMNLVKIVGRAEEVGRPLLYGTTKRFLEVFGLASLDELPKVEALNPPPERPRKSAKPVDQSDESDESDEADEAPDSSETTFDDHASDDSPHLRLAKLAEAAEAADGMTESNKSDESDKSDESEVSSFDGESELDESENAGELEDSGEFDRS